MHLPSTILSLSTLLTLTLAIAIPTPNPTVVNNPTPCNCASGRYLCYSGGGIWTDAGPCGTNILPTAS
ncbi:hypothetical protein B7494_g3448 [Chlorociboria aeruginascens]|nr:hypothetical protein B7494_g3448 [Chlorociboria aeruginascens]